MLYIMFPKLKNKNVKYSTWKILELQYNFVDSRLISDISRELIIYMLVLMVATIRLYFIPVKSYIHNSLTSRVRVNVIVQ